ncbi:NAD-dependent protein deacetylase [Parahaliea aestuarii]|uniref:protein acetyllysine N-acetyltransferase n=1 Tax=Parahaliea aestuarii TaxID=1852021 RepID=A0A5C8ZL90_9GAMM|nr:NAD-dependent protein deacetylase [Parahaliea aestuarii]TXS89346.1 NAD-dependent protein deacetylase [Parahaliea aestuarii]
MNPSHITQLLRFIERHPRLVVLTGAGISAASGIPTYRDHLGNWLHSAPITHQAFVGDEQARRRYWTRSLAGWPPVRDARPNRAHLALASLERAGVVSLLITQNVDRLHQRAGSVQVVDLHGRIDQVRCLACGDTRPRELLQRQFALAGHHPPRVVMATRPDGDADTADSDGKEAVEPPRCGHCGGIIMPDVVFFGGSVPAPTVDRCRAALTDADALLVVGSSLQVYSGFRFCRYARAAGKGLALLNPGQTRADALADLRLHADCAPVLGAVAEALAPGVQAYVP